MSLSGTVSVIHRDIGRKLPIITYPTSIWHLVGGDPLEFRQELWHQKIIPGLSYGVVRMIGFAVLVQYRCVTDGWTDRLTDGRMDT